MTSRGRAIFHGASLVGILVLLAALGAWMLQSTIPRSIVIATGADDTFDHGLFPRYRDILARDGVSLVERKTGGAVENARLVADPRSGVDVAFMHGGVIKEAPGVVMLASLYYEPLWVFYRGSAAPTRLEELRGRRIAIGKPDQGVHAFVAPLLAANGVTATDSELVPVGDMEALHALQAGTVDAAMFVGGAQSPAVVAALHDKGVRLMHFSRAEAYQRRFDHITKLTLPAGTVDLALDIPQDDVALIATEAMLVARDDLAPAIIALLHEAAREVHADQGYFEKPREFPNTDPVDIPVSSYADRHHRFGPSLLHRYLPFFFATFIERLIILLVPLIVVIVPLVNLLPQLLRWRMRSRIYRWYGELSLLERDVASRSGTPPMDQWLATLDRIEAAAARVKTPASYASEAYTLREHIALVRRSIVDKARARPDVEFAS